MAAFRLSAFRLSAFRISVVADSTSVQVFSFHALSGGGVQDSSSVQDLSSTSVHALSGGG